MKKKKTTTGDKKIRSEKTAELKNESTGQHPVQKGYNENNPSQPQGVFKPDAVDQKKN